MTSAPPTAVGTRRFPRVPAAVRPIGRTAPAVLVAALVVGILGMHTLTGHGAPAVPGAAVVARVTGTTSVGSGAHEAAMASGGSHDPHAHDVAAAGHPSGRASVDSGSGSRHDMASMAMLCVLMLAATALTLLAVLAVRIHRPLLPAAFAPAAVRAGRLPWVRNTGPPREWQFSVIRC